MPPKKKTPSSRILKKDISARIWRGCKDCGTGFLELLKLIFDFTYKVIQIILRFWIWIIGGVIILVVGFSIAFYLLVAALGIKDNEAWQGYVSEKIHQVILLENKITNENLDEVEDLDE